MGFPEIDISSAQTIAGSFDVMAGQLFEDYVLCVNNVFYRLLDIEFYYYSEDNYRDVYTHKHPEQMKPGKWYFHGSGIDITIGGHGHHGGILIRAIARISGNGNPGKYYIEDEIHGPLKVKTEICRHLHGVFEQEANTLCLIPVQETDIPYFIPADRYYKTKRIGLNSAKKDGIDFHDARLRYVIFPRLKLKDKTGISKDMLAEGIGIDTINQLLGSKFL